MGIIPLPSLRHLRTLVCLPYLPGHPAPLVEEYRRALPLLLRDTAALALFVFQEAGCGDEHHERVRELGHELLQTPVDGRYAGRPFQDMHHQHPVLRQKAPALRHVVRTAADDGGPDDTHRPNEKVVVVRQCFCVAWVCSIQGYVSGWRSGDDLLD